MFKKIMMVGIVMIALLSGCQKQSEPNIIWYGSEDKGMLFDKSINKTCWYISNEYDNMTIYMLANLKCGGQFGFKQIGNTQVANCGYECNPYLFPEEVDPSLFRFELQEDSNISNITFNMYVS